jgi:hypothetical protein
MLREPRRAGQGRGTNVSGSKAVAASAVAALMAVTGCTSPRSGKKVEKERREAGQTDEPAASALPLESAARGAEKPVEEEEEPRREGRVVRTTRDPDRPGRGIAAVEDAAEAGKYLFAFFRRDDDEQTRKMREVFDATMKKVAGRAESVVIDVSDPSEKGIVKKFGVDRAPMPLVLVLAPNGAIMGGFPSRFDERQLVDAFASPCMEKSLKALQGRKFVLLCVQNSKTKGNGAAMRGVRDFAADARFSSATEIVMLNPTDEAEAKFLGQLGVDPKTDEAITVFLAPPGTAIARFKGATDKDRLVAALAACGAGCGPSAGSTGAT